MSRFTKIFLFGVVLFGAALLWFKGEDLIVTRSRFTSLTTDSDVPVFSSKDAPEHLSDDVTKCSNFVMFIPAGKTVAILHERSHKTDMDFEVKLEDGREVWIFGGFGQFSINKK